MKINYLGDFTFSQKEEINKIINYINIDLALRENNHFCGTGLGGNNFQLLVLSSLENVCSPLYNGVFILTDPKCPFESKVCWGAQFLLESSPTIIREKLDLAFENLSRSLTNYATAMVTSLEVLKNSFSDHKGIKYNDIPVYSKEYAENTPYNKIFLDAIFCVAKLADDIDNGLTYNYYTIGNFLSKIPLDMVLLTFRKVLLLDRIVRASIDEHPAFSKLINDINKIIL